MDKKELTVDNLLYWYNQGLTWSEVDNILGVKNSRRFRKKNNVPSRSRSDAVKLGHKNMSDETKRERHEKMSKNSWMKNHSEEAEKQRVEKWRNTYNKNYDINANKNRQAQLKRYSNPDKRRIFIDKQRCTKTINGTLNPVWLKELTHQQRTEMAYKAIQTKKLKGTFIVPNYNSKPNKSFAELLEYNHIKYEREYFTESYKFVYDFKVNDTLIEINPSYTHNSTYPSYNNDSPLDKNYHKDKSLSAISSGYRCIHVFDWDDKQKIINTLKSRDNQWARCCTVGIVNLDDEKEFLNKHHLQGYIHSEVALGLYDKGGLISIMTFSKPRYNKNFEWELLRYCSSKGVCGGAEKLFKNFITQYNPHSIISYCDTAKFSGDVYYRLGFSLDKVNAPSKHWYNEKTGKHITDNLLRQRGFDQLFGTNYGRGTSNNQLMIDNGFVEIYDCGQSRFSWRK